MMQLDHQKTHCSVNFLLSNHINDETGSKKKVKFEQLLKEWKYILWLTVDGSWFLALNGQSLLHPLYGFEFEGSLLSLWLVPEKGSQGRQVIQIMLDMIPQSILRWLKSADFFSADSPNKAEKMHWVNISKNKDQVHVQFIAGLFTPLQNALQRLPSCSISSMPFGGPIYQLLAMPVI